LDCKANQLSPLQSIATKRGLKSKETQKMHSDTTGFS